jgi:GT2 family glycosyltransferase
VSALTAADVTAVLVAHEGAAWLPRALAALRAQTVRPAAVVCVDTGSTDGSAALLAKAYGGVVKLPPSAGYPEAVAAGLAGAPVHAWVWLLHDDCAPEPGALEALLAHAAADPSAALLGPKVRDWDDPRVLVEVGVTVDGSGHRETGLERREYDQGQHDAVRRVLAVGTAGALVRRDVWDALGGLDPALPVYRDDLDLGWRVNAAGHGVVVVPAARVEHVRAATTGRRRLGAVRGSPEAVDRRHALFVLLAHAGPVRFPLTLLGLVLGSLLRVVGLLLTRQPAGAGDELRALAGLLATPWRLVGARRRRARTRVRARRDIEHLLARRRVRLRARAQAVGDWLSGGASGEPAGAAFGDPQDELAEHAEELAAPARPLLRRPAVLLVLGLAVLTLLAERALLAPGGSLAGGRLLPPPDGASDLWRAYTASWHAASVGSDVPAPPALAVLAGLSGLLLGKAALAVDLLLLACVPVAGLVAHAVAGRVVASPVLRLWAAATWALLPVATGAVAAGRLDAAVGQVALPVLALAGARLLTRDPRDTGWRRAWGFGLGLAAVAAFAPVLWLLTAVVLLAGSVGGWLSAAPVLRRVAARRVRAALVVVGVPVAVLWPWSGLLAARPLLLLHGPGRLDPALAAPVGGWQLALLDPGGPGSPVAVLTLGVLLAALGGTVRQARRRVALAAWGLVAVGLVAAVLLVGLPREPVWPGSALQVAAAGMLLAAVVAGDRVRAGLARTDFGWRQPTVVAVAVLAAAAPVLLAGSWLVRGADDPLTRQPRPLLPAFAAAEVAADPGARVLLLQQRGDGRLAYELTRAGGAGLYDDAVAPSGPQRAALDDVVADLASARGSDAAEALATRAVRYVALRGGAGELSAALDGQRGLVRRASEAGLVLWQVRAPAARLEVLAPPVAARAVRGARAPDPELPAGPASALTAGADLPAGPAGRLLVLAEAADPGWQATLDGRPLPRRTAWGWAQAFALPDGGGRLVLRRDPTPRSRALAVQAAAVLVVVVLAAPAARRRRDLDLADAP